MDQAGGVAISASPFLHHANHGPRVAHVDRGIGDRRPGLAKALQVFAHFSSVAEGLIDLFNFGGAPGRPSRRNARATPP